VGDKLEFGGKNLSREDEVLARVVLDLGVAETSAIQSAIDAVAEARAQGEVRKLADVLRDTGCLHARFAQVVEKVVKTRLGAEAGGPAKSDAQAGPSGSPFSVPRSATGERRADAPGPEDGQDGGPQEGVYARTPKGEGFSSRSKKDVASAWAAYRKGQKSGAKKDEPADGAAPGGGEFAPEGGKKRGTRRPTAAVFATGDAPKEPAPDPIGGSLFPVQPGRSRFPKPEERAVPPTSGIGKQPDATAKKSFTPKHRRGRKAPPSEHSDSIDIASLKEELGITGKPKASADAGAADAVPKDQRQKEIALRAFIKRALPSTLHQQSLEIILRKRLALISSQRLAQEVGCKEREARRVLDGWRAAGMARQDDPEIFQYTFVPAKADLALIREFLTLWSDAGWHQKLLTWILEEETR
jgi:hypothetical protein